MSESKDNAAVPSDRVHLSEHNLHIGDRTFNLTNLATTWSIWNQVESAIKRLTPKITPAELNVLETLELETAGVRGRAELMSALAQAP